MGCILAELYTGEMFFPTHENIEHLAIIEKACGLFPIWMADGAKTENFKDIFDYSSVTDHKVKIMWPDVAKSKGSLKNYDEMKKLDVSE
jgi:hypothetical protein